MPLKPMDNSELITLMIADDHVGLMNGLARNLEMLEKKIRVIGLAESGKMLLDLVKWKQPDVVLLDWSMPILNGPQALIILKRDFPNVKVIMFSYYFSDYLVSDSIINGANGYLRKNIDEKDLIYAIKKVKENGYFFNQTIARDILKKLKATNKSHHIIGNEKFSITEIQVLKLMCEGKTDEEIGKTLNFTKHGTDYYKRILFQKTQSKSIIELIKFAMKQCIHEV